MRVRVDPLTGEDIEEFDGVQVDPLTGEDIAPPSSPTPSFWESIFPSASKAGTKVTIPMPPGMERPSYESDLSRGPEAAMDALTLPTRALGSATDPFLPGNARGDNPDGSRKSFSQGLANPDAGMMRPAREFLGEAAKSQMQKATSGEGSYLKRAGHAALGEMAGAGYVASSIVEDPFFLGTAAAGTKTAAKVADKVGQGLEKVGQDQMYRILKPGIPAERKGFDVKTVFNEKIEGNVEKVHEGSKKKIEALSRLLRQKIKSGADEGVRIDLPREIDLAVAEIKANPGKSKETVAIIEHLEDELLRMKDRALKLDPKGLGRVDLEAAQSFKQDMGDRGAWRNIAKSRGIPLQSNQSAESLIAERVYRHLNDVIDQSAPEGVREINRRLSQLIPVNQAAGHRAIIEGRQNKISMSDALSAIATAANPKFWPMFGVTKAAKSGTLAGKIYRVGEMLRTAKTSEEKARYVQVLQKLGLSEDEIRSGLEVVEASGGEQAFKSQDLRIRDTQQAAPRPSNAVDFPEAPRPPAREPKEGIGAVDAYNRRVLATRYLQETTGQVPEQKDVYNFLDQLGGQPVPKVPEKPKVHRKFEGRRDARHLEIQDNLLREGDADYPTQTIAVKDAPEKFTLNETEYRRVKGQWDNRVYYKDSKGRQYDFRGDETIHMDPEGGPVRPPSRPLQEPTEVDDFIGEDGQPLFQGGPRPSSNPDKQQEIEGLFRYATKKSSNEKKTVELGSVSEEMAERTLKDAGVDVSGYRHIIDNFSVNHILKKHGGADEIKRGQLPISQDDFQRLPEILENPDRIERAPDTHQGKAAIMYTKRFNGTTYYIEAIRKNQELYPVTMYKRKSAGTSNLESLRKPNSDTPEALPGNTNIPPESPDGKRLHQDQGLQSPKGQIFRRKNTSTITFYRGKGDVSTWMHEHSHWLRTNAMGDLENQKALASMGRKDWDEAAEEKFADGFERYLYNGKAPNKDLARSFETMKSRFREVYKETKGTNLEEDIPEEMQAIYDALLLKNRKVKNPGRLKLLVKSMQKASKPVAAKILIKIREELESAE